MANNKKRAYVYVDIDKYERLKRILEAMGVTMTDFFDQSMTEFIDSMEQVILNEDKEGFLQMMSKNLDSMQKQLTEELKKPNSKANKI
jgi:hypothetical protein